MTFGWAGIFIAFLLVVWLVILKKKVPGRAPFTKPGAAPIVAGGRGPISMWKNDRDASVPDAEAEAVLKLYPILREIPYSPVISGPWPTGPGEIDAGIQKEIADRLSSLGPIHGNSAKLLNLLRDPESNPGEITAIVSTNPVFSAKILESVNSAFFHLPEKMTTVGRAITLLGYNNVRSLVLQDTLHTLLPRRSDPDSHSFVRLWIHSAVVSVCAGYLGKKLFRLPEYDLATVGLLHDLGKYFIHTLPHTTDEPEDLPPVAEEERIYRVNHAALGSILADHWQLPRLISGSIAYHHHPVFLPPETIPREYGAYSFIICLSDLVAKLLDSDGPVNDLFPVREEYFGIFGVKKDVAGLITPALIKEVDKARRTVESYAALTHGAGSPE